MRKINKVEKKKKKIVSKIIHWMSIYSVYTCGLMMAAVKGERFVFELFNSYGWLV